MAIDDREKRAAVPGVGRPFMRGKLPVATPDFEWRAATGFSWGGNALSPGAGRVMGALAGHGGLAGPGGLAGMRGGMAG